MIDATASIPLIGASPKREAAINRKRIKAGLPPVWSVCRGVARQRCAAVGLAADPDWDWIVESVVEYGLNPEGMRIMPPVPCDADGKTVDPTTPNHYLKRRCLWPKHPVYWGFIDAWETEDAWNFQPDASLHRVIHSEAAFAFDPRCADASALGVR